MIGRDMPAHRISRACSAERKATPLARVNNQPPALRTCSEQLDHSNHNYSFRSQRNILNSLTSS